MPKFKAAAEEAGVDYKQEDGLGASETLDLKLAGNFQFWSFIVLDAIPRTMRSAPFWKNPGTSFRCCMYLSLGLDHPVTIKVLARGRFCISSARIGPFLPCFPGSMRDMTWVVLCSLRQCSRPCMRPERMGSSTVDLIKSKDSLRRSSTIVDLRTCHVSCPLS